MSNNNNNQVRRVPLAKLKAHPKQGDIYETLPVAELRALADNMKSEGLRDPVEVMPAKNKAGLPAGTIVDGHNRVAAAKILGWRQIDVVIRYDLLDVDTDAAEAAYISANLRRRQLHPLDKAAAALRAYELEIHKSGFGDMDYGEIAEAYARISAAAGYSGRHLNRLINVLRTPRAIQRGVRDDQLPIVMADRISRLSQEDQQKLAAEIQSLGDVSKIKLVAARYVGAPNGRHRGIGDAFACFARNLKKGLADLDGRDLSVSQKLIATYESTLRLAHVRITHWLGASETTGKDIVS